MAYGMRARALTPLSTYSRFLNFNQIELKLSNFNFNLETRPVAGTFLLSAPAVAAGGPQLRDLSLSSELFKASSMQAVVSISKLEYQ